MSKTTAFLFFVAVAMASQASAASGPCQTLTAQAAAGSNPFQIKQDIKVALADIEMRHQPFLGISPRIAALKSAFEQLAKDLIVLDKKIAVLLKDRNFTSGHPGKILAATSKHERLIKDIDASIERIERQKETNKQSLAALQAEVAQFATYINGDFIQDLEAVGDIQTSIPKNLNITESDVRGYLASAFKLFNALESLRQNLPNTQQALASAEIKASSVNSTMDNHMKTIVGKYRTHGQIDYQLDPDSTDIPQTSHRALFERIPEPGELVVIEGRFSATPEKVATDSSNIKGQKFALVDKSLVLEGIRHGDIYTDGTTTYGVIGFIQGRVMLQLVESKSYLPSAVLRTFRSMETKALTKSYRKAGYNSYNRPLLLGDRVGLVATGETMLIIDPESIKKAPREAWYLENWDPKDTGGIGPGLKFWNTPTRSEVSSSTYFTRSDRQLDFRIDVWNPDVDGRSFMATNDRKEYTKEFHRRSGELLLKQVGIYEYVSRVDGITADGTFLVGTQRYVSKADVIKWEGSYKPEYHGYYLENAPQKKYSVVTSVPMTSDPAGVAHLKQRLLDAAQEYNYFYSAQEGDLEAYLDMTYEQAQELIQQFEQRVSSALPHPFLHPVRQSYQDILNLVEQNPKPIPDDAVFKPLSQILKGHSPPVATPMLGKGYRPQHY